jgi:hypothetical protein
MEADMKYFYVDYGVAQAVQVAALKEATRLLGRRKPGAPQPGRPPRRGGSWQPAALLLILLVGPAALLILNWIQ